MGLIEFNHHPSRRELRVFGILLVVFCAGVGWVVAGKSGSVAIGMAIAIAGAITGLAGLVRLDWLRLVYVGWMTAVSPIGWVVSMLMMAGVFYLVVTPIALVMRMTGRDALRLKLDRNASSYWEKRVQTMDPRRYFRQY